MSKLLGIGCLLVTLVLTIACGGGGGSDSSRSIAGAIDNGVLSKSTLESGTYEVWAEQSGTRVKKGTISIATSSSEDSTYQIDGLTDGQTYEIVVYRVVGFDRVSMMSTVVTASSSSGSLTKAGSGRAKTLYKRQINMVTTYVAQQYVSAITSTTTTTVTITSIITTVFGSSTVSLEEVVSDGGTLTTQAGTGLVIADPVATAAVTQLTFATVAMGAMTGTNVAAQAATFSSFRTTMVSATTTTSILSATSSSISGLINAAIASSSAAAFNALAAAADKTAAAAFASGGSLVAGLASLTTASTQVFAAATLTQFSIRAAVAATNGGTLSTTLSSTFLSTISTQSGVNSATLTTLSQTAIATVGAAVGLTTQQITNAQGSASGTTPGAGTSATELTVTGFELAHATAYGTQSGNAFTIHTLSPVFKVTFNKAFPTNVSSLFAVTLTNTTTNATQTLSNIANTVTRVNGSSGKVIYLMVHKTGAVASTNGSELKPGTTYNYRITPGSNSTHTIKSGSIATRGTITTKNVTFSLPFTGTGSGNYSQVNLLESTSFNGVPSSSAVTFYVASKNYIEYSPSTSSTYGLIGTSGNLNVVVNGAVTSGQSGSGLTVSSISTATNTGWAKGFAVALSSSLLSSGNHYMTVGLSSSGNVAYTVADDNAADGVLTTTDIPTRVDLTVQ